MAPQNQVKLQLCLWLPSRDTTYNSGEVEVEAGNPKEGPAVFMEGQSLLSWWMLCPKVRRMACFLIPCSK